jgi:hypothetical protein
MHVSVATDRLVGKSERCYEIKHVSAAVGGGDLYSVVPEVMQRGHVTESDAYPVWRGGPIFLS